MNSRNPLLATICLAMLAACAGNAAPDPRIADARRNLEQARGDPNVARYGTAELQQADNSLVAAEGAAHVGDHPQLDHSLYMAQRQIDVARARADADATHIQTAALAQQLQVQSAQLRDRASAPPAGPPPSNVLTLTDVLFEPGRAVLRPGALNRLRPMVSFLKTHPDASATIEGFTDARGTPERNRELSEARALAGKDAIVGEGVEPSRVAARGMGEEFPIASNDTPFGRQQNRRVEVLLSEAPQ